MLYRIILTLLVNFLLFSSLENFAQIGRSKVWNLPTYDKKPLHFGFTLGLSNLSFSMRHAEDFLQRNNSGDYVHSQVYAIESVPSPGFHLGGLANLRLNEYFDFRTLFILSFGQRDLNYTIRQIKKDGTEEWITESVKIESINTQLPLLIKLKAERINNYRPFLIAGINPYLDLAAGSKDEDPFVHLKSFDILYEAGVGIDFYLQYFKFATELKYSFGINNMLQQDGSIYSQSVDGLYTHMFTLSFNFE